MEELPQDKQTPWEDQLLERKTDRQLSDIRRTAVAFANSVKPGHTAMILVGEGNDGTVSGIPNPDEQQRRLRQELEKIYPPIVWRQSLYENQGKTCIRLEIEYSGDTPHFGDGAWIRHGSETVRASDLMLQKLVESRLSKLRELMKWQGKPVTVSWAMGFIGSSPNWGKFDCELVYAGAHFVTFDVPGRGRRSEPIAWLELSWDDKVQRLRIFVDPHMSTMG